MPRTSSTPSPEHNQNTSGSFIEIKQVAHAGAIERDLHFRFSPIWRSLPPLAARNRRQRGDVIIFLLRRLLSRTRKEQATTQPVPKALRTHKQRAQAHTHRAAEANKCFVKIVLHEISADLIHDSLILMVVKLGGINCREPAPQRQEMHIGTRTALTQLHTPLECCARTHAHVALALSCFPDISQTNREAIDIPSESLGQDSMKLPSNSRYNPSPFVRLNLSAPLMCSTSNLPVSKCTWKSTGGDG
jgi:hypothetical protein